MTSAIIGHVAGTCSGCEQELQGRDVMMQGLEQMRQEGRHRW